MVLGKRVLTRRACAAAAAIAAGVAITGGGISAAADTRLLETGSSLLYPLFNLWVPAYTQKYASVQITTQSTGSGTGISQAVSGLAQIGASDAYLSRALSKQHPDILNIPLAISSQMVNYNLPGLNGDHLKLSGPILAAIYQGKITKWNDPRIAQVNHGVSLPDKTIVPIHRTDGSGDTFIFTQFLSDSEKAWGSSLSYGTSISWPSVSGGIGAVGNQGMANTLRQSQYSIAYIGISFKGAITQDKMGEAKLENRAGQFVLPDDQTVQAAANSQISKTPANQSVSLIFSPGAQSYPIINYEYAIVNSRQPSSAMAEAVKQFLTWGISPSGGNASSFMAKVNFVALPDSIRTLSKAQIDKISG